MALTSKLIIAKTDKTFEKKLDEHLATVSRGSVQYRFADGIHTALVISDDLPNDSKDKA